MRPQRKWPHPIKFWWEKASLMAWWSIRFGSDDNSEVKRTLGVCHAPIGNDKTEYEYHLNEATKTWSCLLRAPLDREKTRIGFMSMILSKFSWPLGATCFSEKQCLNIQCKFMGTVLSKMGINWTMSMAVRSSPTMYAGMGVPKLWPIQGASKNKLLIGHLHKSDLVGNNLRVELDCLQLQAGTSWNVLKPSKRLHFFWWCTKVISLLDVGIWLLPSHEPFNIWGHLLPLWLRKVIHHWTKTPINTSTTGGKMSAKVASQWKDMPTLWLRSTECSTPATTTPIALGMHSTNICMLSERFTLYTTK